MDNSYLKAQEIGIRMRFFKVTSWVKVTIPQQICYRGSSDHWNGVALGGRSGAGSYHSNSCGFSSL